jgi:hypothetical protein
MRFFLLVLVLLLSACGTKTYEHTQSKVITIKTPKLRFSDLGYIKHTGEDVRVELFTAGKMVQSIEIYYLICVNEGCMGKTAFNESYLNANYPKDILENIILGKHIYNRRNFVKTRDGFEQYIKNNNVNIKYKVSANEIYFKDRKNAIMFKIRDVE